MLDNKKYNQKRLSKTKFNPKNQYFSVENVFLTHSTITKKKPLLLNSVRVSVAISELRSDLNWSKKKTE